MINAEQLLEEVAELARKKLSEQEASVKQVVANLEVNIETYVKLMVSEVVREFTVDAQFAFPPLQNHTPEEVKKKALEFLTKKFERDKRLYLP